jgi:hypothetical protein
LAAPTNRRAPPIVHSCMLIQMVKAQGKTITDPMTATAGTTKGQ